MKLCPQEFKNLTSASHSALCMHMASVTIQKGMITSTLAFVHISSLQVAVMFPYLLLICFWCLPNCLFGQTVINAATGVYSTKRQSDGLTLPATSGTFQPIGELTTKIHLTKSYSVFIHYQVTISSSNTDFWSKLQVNHFNAGSLVHSGNQLYKTAAGFWVGNLNPGYYSFEVHYKSSTTISISASSDWQTAVINVMWFEDSYAVSDNIKCYPSPTTLNTYNNLGPINDVEAILQQPSSRVVLAAYQMSVEPSSKGWFVSKMNINNLYEESMTVIEDHNNYLNHHSLVAKYLRRGVHYFGLTYRTTYSSQFTDCLHKYNGNTNIYAIYLPSGCSVVNILPTTSLSYSTTWTDTDLKYTFTISGLYHVIVRYQFTKEAHQTYTIARLTINSVPQPHTSSIRGNKDVYNAGLFGLWQGSLSTGTYRFTIQHLGGASSTHYTSNDYLTRAMDVVYCQ